MADTPLPLYLRQIAMQFRQFAKVGADVPAATCMRVALMLQLAARQADELTAKAGDVDELEDELLAVAHDLDRVAGEPPTPSFQSALKAQQRAIQAQLDRGGPEHVWRPGLAALATQIGGSNVFSFPKAPGGIRMVDRAGEYVAVSGLDGGADS